MPDCDQFIVSAWHDLGVCQSGMNGLSPIPFTEIKAYSDSVCELSSFDVSIIAKMSRIYVSEQSAATKDKLRPCDLENDIEFYRKVKEFNKQEVSRRMREFSRQNTSR